MTCNPFGVYSGEYPRDLLEAQRLAIHVPEQIVKETKPGQTEKQEASRADSLIKELGEIGVWAPTVVGFGIGTLSCFPTDIPCDRPLWNIDLGDVGVYLITASGWCGDYTRTLHVGGNRPQGAAFAALKNIHQRVSSSAYPGMRACDLFEIFEQALKPTTYLLLDHLQNIGHSLTQNSSYDGGYLDAFNETSLEGAWAVEPFIGNHLYGVKLEDVLWLGKTKVTVVK
ncbi:Creatinase/aminopeptidase [Hyaloscypha variabilis]